MVERKLLPFAQGLYFIMTSLWPLLHLESFLQITGYKTDTWLVRTVGILLFPYGLLAIYAAFSKKNAIVGVVCGLSCFGLAVIDLYYYLAGVIKWVYLIDCFLQSVFVIYWIFYVITNKVNNKFFD